MEAGERPVTGRTKLRRRVRAASALVTAIAAGLVSSAVRAEPLDEKIPGLFGGSLRISLARNAEPRQPGVTARFSSLSPDLAAARSQAPVPSASGSFRFTWDPEVETFVRSRQSLGSILAERAQTLGRHYGTVSVSYTHLNFDTLEGDPLSHLRSVEPAFSSAFLKNLPEADRAIAGDDQLETQLALSIQLDQIFLTLAYGITNSLDVSLALSLNRIGMKATAQAFIRDRAGNGGAIFGRDQPGVCGGDLHCARDEFDASAFGTGDLFLRAKYLLYESAYIDAAVASVLTLPTGNADDFLGFHDPTYTPWIILSNTFGRFEPHLNIGYAFRSGEDVSQAEWIAGSDFYAWPWLTLFSDFLGYHDDTRDGVNDNIIQWAGGFKVNPIRRGVIGAAFQLPVNRDGVRADVVYTAQVEYTF